jgi:hypothetical protein
LWNSSIIELSNQDSNETKVAMSSHHFFSCSKVQELDMVMTTKDIAKSNLTGEKGIALKYPHPLLEKAMQQGHL